MSNQPKTEVNTPKLIFFMVLLGLFSELSYSHEYLSRFVLKAPNYESAFFGSFDFLYLRTNATDADFEYGTLITLTPTPPTLTAHLQAIKPRSQPAYKAMVGYQFENDCPDVRLSYFSFSQGFNQDTQIETVNQIIQNYLGNSLRTANAHTSIDVDQINLTLGKHVTLDRILTLHPFIGLSYAQIKRTFDTTYTGPILNPLLSGTLTGNSYSRYRGLGPILGVDFNLALMRCFSLMGSFSSALYYGNVDYDIWSTFLLGDTQTSYERDISDNSHASLFLNGELGLRFAKAVLKQAYLAEMIVGYQVSDYLNSMGRINPLNGYANNPATNNPPGISNLSSLSFNGPFVRVALMPHEKEQSHQYAVAQSPDINYQSGWMANISGLLLEPFGSDADLDYALRRGPAYFRTNPGFHWGGDASIGYINKHCHSDIKLFYTHLDTGNTSSINGGGIFSLDSNGPESAQFSNASSKINYHFNEASVQIGKYFPIGKLLMNVFTGVDVASIIREQHNTYTGGEPGLVSQDKFAKLRSKFVGVGPMFGLLGHFGLGHNISFNFQTSVAMLIGDFHTTINLSEVDSADIPSFTDLNRKNPKSLVPSVTGKAELQYSWCLSNHSAFQISAGLRASDYFRAVSLVYPVFRTGLEQRNTSFVTAGPYVSFGIVGV